jgi:hypothetical protein
MAVRSLPPCALARSAGRRACDVSHALRLRNPQQKVTTLPPSYAKASEDMPVSRLALAPESSFSLSRLFLNGLLTADLRLRLFRCPASLRLTGHPGESRGPPGSPDGFRLSRLSVFSETALRDAVAPARRLLRANGDVAAACSFPFVLRRPRVAGPSRSTVCCFSDSPFRRHGGGDGVVSARMIRRPAGGQTDG